MTQQGKNTKTRTRIRPTINDSLNESLKNAQNINKKSTPIEVIQETEAEKKLRERQQFKRFSKQKFGIDDSHAKTVEIGEGVNIDHEQAQRHMEELSRSRFAHEIDQDEAFVQTMENQNIGYQNVNQDQPPLVGTTKQEKLSYAVAISSREIDILKDNIPHFHRIKDAPGYQDRMIRQLGRTVFRKVPTYTKMEEMCREAGVDPHGQIKTICTATDTSPYHRRSIEQVASWIQVNGKVIDAKESDFGREFGVMDGYRPREIVATTDDMTFLLVHEDENSPMGEQYYIYTFQGGHTPNLENAGDEYSYEAQKKKALPTRSNNKIKEIEAIPQNNNDEPSMF